MSLYKQWTDLIDSQTDATFEEFWELYSTTEQRIYDGILTEKNPHVEGTFTELAAKYEADHKIFMGFLDGIQGSIEAPFDLEAVTEESDIVLDIKWEDLFYNMINAEADYLFGLESWDGILTLDERKAIADKWRKSRTVVKEKEPGRNDPCPCGSGKKYKKCCGANK
ncbi:MAG: SEC-C domain-containing protein [Clostridiales bacterium]|nr:SEC-C domain-containing protein [Clostridiales bacterium]